jgi:asparagine synthase (glutamine-hydrolysing)
VPFTYLDIFNLGTIARTGAEYLAKVLPVTNEKRSKYALLYRLIELAKFNDPVKIYNSATANAFTGYEDNFLKSPDLRQMSEALMAIKALPISSLNKLLLCDFKSLLPGTLLPKMDIATMANSIEGRSPFLSKEILEMAPSFPDSFKIRGVTTKYILRDLSKKYLPPELVNQPKRGFEIPLMKWVNGHLRDVIGDYLSNSNNIHSSFIDRNFVQELVANRIKISQEKRAKMLFRIFGLEVWHQNLSSMKNRDQKTVIHS